MSLRSLGDVVSRTGSCVTISEDATVYNLVEALASSRVKAISVLSLETGGLTGIATNRDAAKCVARGEDLRALTVAQIMTPHPVTLPPAETPANALALMREGGFRHVPVVSEDDGTVLGIIDVLDLAYDAITRLQVSYSMIPTRRGFEFMRLARETMEKPTLRPIVENTRAATITGDCSVAEACETLVQERLAAVVVVNEQGVLDGIFTSSDVVKRVIIANRNPVRTNVSQVMTINPDSAASDFTILESLQRMQACGFRHLPVVESHTRVVVGLVDVLQLASAAVSGLETVARHSRSQASNARPQLRGFASIFSSLFSSSLYATAEEVEVQQRAQRVQQPKQQPPVPPLSTGYCRSMPVIQGLRGDNHMRSDPTSSLSGSRFRGIPDNVPLASFKFRDINNEYCRIKVPMTFEPGAFDQFVINVRRRFAGSERVGPIKIKYVDEDDDEVLISNDDDLISCFEDFEHFRNRTIHLKVIALDNSTSSQIQSPVSSTPSSVIDSPRHQLLPSAGRQDDGQSFNAPSDTVSVQNERTGGLARTTSAQVVQTPSMLKANEAQKMMFEKVEKSVDLYNEALKLDPKNARALGGRAAAHLINGDSTKAEEGFRAAMELVSDNNGQISDHFTLQSCIVGLVESLIDQRRYEEAVAVARRLDQGDTRCIDAFQAELDSASDAARQALEERDFGDAMNCYTNALRVESGYLQLVQDETARASLRLGRAKCYKALCDFDMALEDYEVAVQIESESVAGHKGCGKCFAEMEQFDRALEAYERAQALDPADDEVNKEIEVLKSLRPDPLQGKKEEIAKIGALFKNALL